MGVAPTLPGIPDSASTPIQPSCTARSTNASHDSPAATVTTAPPQASWAGSTPEVSTSTTVPSKPASPTTRLLPPATSSSGVPDSSAERTASRSSCSVRARTSSRAGPPRCSVVWSASRVGRSATQHRLGHAEHLLPAAGALEGHPHAVLGALLDGAADHDVHAEVVVGHHGRLGELRTELHDVPGAAGPGVEGPGGEREGVHPVRDHTGQPDRGGHPVGPVDRVEVAAGAGVADQVGAGDGVGLLGQGVPRLEPGQVAHEPSPRCIKVANAVHTCCPAASVTSLRVPMMSAPLIWRSESTVRVAVRASPSTTGRV